MYGGQGGSEKHLGAALGERRKDIVLASKFGWEMDSEGKKRGASRGYIIQAVEDSLRRLNTDWIDLYQLHKPDPLHAHRRNPERAGYADPARQNSIYRLIKP